MKVLCFYDNECTVELSKWSDNEGHKAVLHNDRLEAILCKGKAFDLVVGHTYRFILNQDILDVLNKNVVMAYQSGIILRCVA